MLSQLAFEILFRLKAVVLTEFGCIDLSKANRNWDIHAERDLQRVTVYYAEFSCS